MKDFIRFIFALSWWFICMVILITVSASIVVIVGKVIFELVKWLF